MSLQSRAFYELDVRPDMVAAFDVKQSKDVAWKILKHPSNGFEKYALKFIAKNFIVPRKPFCLAEVIVYLSDEWMKLDLTTKYYFTHI